MSLPKDFHVGDVLEVTYIGTWSNATKKYIVTIKILSIHSVNGRVNLLELDGNDRRTIRFIEEKGKVLYYNGETWFVVELKKV